MFNKNQKFFIGILGVLCVMALTVGTLYVPISFGASAAVIPVQDDETVVFTFSADEESVKNSGDANNLTRGDDGMGCAGWGPTLQANCEGDPYTELGFTHTDSSANWADPGGYRLNNKDGVYYLQPNSTYVVSFKLKVTSTPLSEGALSGKTVKSYLNIGYGFTGTTGSGNKVNGMKNVVSEVFSATSVSAAESKNAEYKLTTALGSQSVKVSNEWHNITYVFTTPSSLDNGNPALGFYSSSYYGTSFRIDDVSVTKLGSNTGVVTLIDEYYGTAEVLTGKLDTAVTLPTLTGTSEEHEFKGWYKDAARSETAEGAVFAKESQTFYSAWKAPVTVTFNDTLNNRTYTSTGLAGEKIDIPQNLTDGVNDPVEKWFMGWYTSSKYTEKFTDEEFGYSNITLYSKWQGEEADQIEDFESYTADKRTWTTKDGENTIWGNAFSFGTAYSKVDDPTNSGKGKMIALNWDSSMEKIPSDPDTYSAAARFSSLDNMIYMQNIKLTEDAYYTVTFDYYVKNISETQVVNVFTHSGHSSSVWGNNINFKDKQNAYFSVDYSDKDGQWHTGKINFKMQMSKETNNAIYIIMRLAENSDTEIYIDNIKFSAVQPYESAVMYIANNNKPNTMQKGLKGSTLAEYIPENGELTFAGWYEDTGFTKPFTKTVFPDDSYTVYGKWSGYVEDFKEYKYKTGDSLVFGQNMSVVSEVGRGLDDNYVLNFTFDASKEYSVDKTTGKVTYWASRAESWYDNIARFGTLENHTGYKISYYYRLNSNSKNGTSINIVTCHGDNIWDSGYRTTYTYATTEVPVDASGEWVYVECEIFTDFQKDNGNMLYFALRTDAKIGDMTTYIDIDIDHVVIKELPTPYVFFDAQNSLSYEFVKGTDGSAINFPANPTKASYEFTGWYTDKECTELFTKTHFESGDKIVLYAGYKKSNTAYYDFEVYNFKNPTGWFVYGGGAEVINTKSAFSGNKVIKFDRDTTLTLGGRTGYALIGSDTEGYSVQSGTEYLVTFKYYIEKSGDRDAKINFQAGHVTSYWHNNATLSNSYTVSVSAKEGKWYTGVAVIDGSKIKNETSNAVFVCVSNGDNGIYYIDDITILTVADGYKAYTVDNGGCSSVPLYVMGKIGTSFQKMLPNAPTMDNAYFAGYTMYDANNNLSDLLPEKMVFSEDSMRITANFVRTVTTQSFEKSDAYEKLLGSYADYCSLDFDYEIYDTLADGNSKENAADGRYSLHRKGTTYHFENAQILSADKSLTVNQKYTITMKVKMGNYLQTDGAIKIGSCRTPYFPWSISGDYHSIAAIKDLTDGEWHELSFTFTAVEAFLSIQTPGYCEMFIDDIVITRVDGTVETSKDAVYTEYVPAKRDANGNLLNASAWNASVESIVDASLGIRSGSNNTLLYVLIGGGAVVVIAAAVVVVLLVAKKRRKNKTV